MTHQPSEDLRSTPERLSDKESERFEETSQNLRELKKSFEEKFTKKYGESLGLFLIPQINGDYKIWAIENVEYELLSFIASREALVRAEMVEKIRDIHTELHNGRMETAYKLVSTLLLSLPETKK